MDSHICIVHQPPNDLHSEYQSLLRQKASLLQRVEPFMHPLAHNATGPSSILSLVTGESVALATFNSFTFTSRLLGHTRDTLHTDALDGDYVTITVRVTLISTSMCVCVCVRVFCVCECLNDHSLFTFSPPRTCITRQLTSQSLGSNLPLFLPARVGVFIQLQWLKYSANTVQ